MIRTYYRYYPDLRHRIELIRNSGSSKFPTDIFHEKYLTQELIEGEWVNTQGYFKAYTDYHNNKELLTEAEYLARSSKLGRILYD